MARKTLDEQHIELTKILEDLLSEDQDITLRAVSRRHSTLKSASTITRHPQRRELVVKFRERQAELRLWKGRLGKTSKEGVANKLATQDTRIEELERLVGTLTTGHLALIAAVGQVGGMGKLAKFYENFREIRKSLYEAGAIPVERKNTVATIRKNSR